MQCFCGVDVSKNTLDLAIRRAGRTVLRRELTNSQSGWKQVLSVLKPGTVVALEPTGSYHQGLLAFLIQAGFDVRLVNPARVRHFLRSLGRGDKTDRKDAELIALFAEKVDGKPFLPKTQAQTQLQELNARQRQLEDMLRAEKNRLEATSNPTAVKQINRHIKLLNEQIHEIEQEAQATVERDSEMRACAQLLTSIPGVGRKSARIILGELPDLRSFRSAKQLACYVGLAPMIKQSGTSLSQSYIPKAGKPRLRQALYFPTMAAVRYNPLLKEQYERLIIAGKSKKLALLAAMHKLLRICYGVLKNQQPFNPEFAHAA